MVAQSLIVKLEGANQLAQASALVGKTATVHQVTTGAGTIGTKLVLLPQGTSGTGGLVVKLESMRQAAEVSALVGKTVTVGTIPSAFGTAGGSWMILQPLGVAAKAGAATKVTMITAAATVSAGATAAKIGGVAAAGAATAKVGTVAVAGAGGGALAAAGVGGAAAGKSLVTNSLAGGTLATKSALGSSILFSQGAATTLGAGALTFTGMAVPFLAGGMLAGAGYLVYQYIAKKKRDAAQDESLDDDDIADVATA